jgi:hypothetical protein
MYKYINSLKESYKMKTFKKFIEESYMILERRGKFKGTRSPEEIDYIRSKRSQSNSMENNYEMTPTQKRTVKRAKELLRIHHKKAIESPEKLNSTHQQVANIYGKMIWNRNSPHFQGQVLDTNRAAGIDATQYRRHRQLKRKIAQKKGNPDVVKPSEHPDTHQSKASEFDKIVQQRRRRRNQKQNKKEVENSREKSKKFRRDEIAKTVGNINR